MIEKPKKERRFLKALGRVGEILIQEVLIKIGSNLIRKIGGKKTLPSILFLLVSLTLFAQFPNTGNKQRLGFQTTGDGLIWRGSLSDTASIQPINNQNAWVILDTVNLKIYSFDFTSNVWNPLPQGTTLDTTSLSNRINLKLNISDTAAMLLPYAKKSYVDTAGRFYARQDFSNVSTSTLTWTQTDTLVPAGVNVVQVYRNGQILLPSQYTIPTKTSVIIAATSFKVGENYTVIFPKGGGGSGGGSGSLTSISGGTGITVSPNPITTTGTVSADLSVLMELTDTSLLNLTSRFATKLNISDTAAMLANYATKAYADTTGRLYARQDFTNVSSSTLTWTESDTLIPGGVTFVQVYRNGQILLPSQYTIPTKTSIVIAAASFKIGENYTVIFPRGGGAGSGGGSGSLTSISGGTGITVNPNPITTTGTVSADLSVLMELTDTSLLNLTSRFATKQNNITLTTTGTSGAATLSGATLNIPQYSGGGSGTVTSVGSGYGLLGGTITTTGTLRVDTSTVYDFIRDSIVAVEIGGDTIKIIKQEYISVTNDTLVFTILPKFPIQLRQFILLFRNGQLLLNDQFSIIDTNKVKVAATSFKLGENYTLVTVSGIGSVSSAQGNPVYPEAGIALSTGSAWASSVPNNSANWNIAFNDKINNAAFSGTNTKTLTLTQYDGGTFTPTFDDLQGIVAADTASMLTPYLRKADTSLLNLPSRFATKLNISDTASMLTNYLRSGVAASTYQTILTNPVTGTGISSFLTRFTGTSTLDSTRLFYSSGRLGINMDASEAASHLTSRFVIRDFGHNFKFDGSAAGSGYTTTFSHDDTGLKIGQSSNIRDIRFTLNGTSGLTIANNSNSPARAVGIGNDSPSHQLDVTGTFRATGAATLSSTLAVTGNITEGGNNVLTNLDTASLSSRIDLKLNKTDTASLSSRIDTKLSAIDTTSLSNRINLKYNSTGGTISGAVTLSTTTATPTALLGKDGSNVVGAVTTVAQTGLMRTGSLEILTGNPSGTFSVTHNLGSNPTSVLVTGVGAIGAQKLIYEVYAKNNTTFSVQVWNYDGTAAANITVQIYWLALK